MGLKPTNGLIGRDPTPSWIDLSTKGPLAVSVADAALLLDVLRGPTPGDPTALPAWGPREGVWPSRLLVAPGWSKAARFRRPSPLCSTKRSCARGRDRPRRRNRWTPPFPAQLDLDWFITVGTEELTWIGREVVAERGDELTPYLRGALAYAATFTVDDYLAARRRRFEIRQGA